MSMAKFRTDVEDQKLRKYSIDYWATVYLTLTHLCEFSNCDRVDCCWLCKIKDSFLMQVKTTSSAIYAS